ncbi:MAG: aminotransferase class III-fold pyridoxal phosphate-dependent enzyme, partial [bacterium]
MAKVYEMIPKDVKKINTCFRRIQTKFPVPESIPILENLQKYEPISMQGQPLIVWDKAKDFQIFDKWGNIWLDWSSGVLVTNAGHSNSKIQEAIINQVNYGLLHNYCFPSEMRAKLAEKLVNLAPKSLGKVFLLTTGSEATECVLKLSRTYGFKNGGKEKIKMISFTGAFHGRTLGSQMMGGIPSLKDWIINLDKDIQQVPFPNCFRCPWGKENYQNCDKECFENFKNYLSSISVSPNQIAGIITETYQGGGSTFLPKGFVKLLSNFCKENDILLTFDEVQAGFGRTGKMFAFEHYEVEPDLICCGKGITSSLPLSAVIGRNDVMDLYQARAMTSTHTGNPVCIAAALASIDCIVENNLVKNADEIGKILLEELEKIQKDFKDVVGVIQGKGLVYGMHIVMPKTKTPNPDLAFELVGKAVEKGLALFTPVGEATLKIAPPLTITKEAIKDG